MLRCGPATQPAMPARQAHRAHVVRLDAVAAVLHHLAREFQVARALDEGLGRQHHLLAGRGKRIGDPEPVLEAQLVPARTDDLAEVDNVRRRLRDRGIELHHRVARPVVKQRAQRQLHFHGLRERAEGVLAAFGMSVEFGHPGRARHEIPAVRERRVDRVAPDPRHLRHVGGAALASLDLHRAHAHAQERRQQLDRVQARRFLDRVVGRSIDVEPSLAQRGIGSALAGRVAVDEHPVQARLEPGGRLLPAHGVRRRAGALAYWANRRRRRPRARSAPRPSRTARRSRTPRSPPACWRTTCSTCASESTRGSTARRTPKRSW